MTTARPDEIDTPSTEDQDIAEVIADAETFAEMWLADIKDRKMHAEINGHGVAKLYLLTNKLRNAAASKQAMRLITGEVRRLHRLADEANAAQSEFAKETIVAQREFTSALVALNGALVDMAARMLRLEEHQHELETPTDKQVRKAQEEKS